MKPSDYIRRGWCREKTAKNAQGEPCHPWSLEAVAWCLEGALRAFTEVTLGTCVLPKQQRAVLYGKVHALGFSHLADYNDAAGRTQQEVIDLLVSAEL